MRLQVIKPGWDIVFIAQPEAAGADYHELKNSVARLLGQAQLLMDDDKTVNPRFDWTISNDDIGSYSAFLPLSTHLLALCSWSDWKVWIY
jgi:hypothetical protein